jgi:hypothetical protein
VFEGAKPDKLIFGVAEDIVQAFLALIRDNYRKADRASYFMEEHGHIMNTSAVANLRDVLSHLASLLDPATPPDKHRAQLENAEEHLRRAILEPYLVVIGRDRREYRRLIEEYEREVLPRKDRYHQLAAAPEMSEVKKLEREIALLVAKGRTAKAMNLWNPEWENGVAALLKAHPLQTKLSLEIGRYVNECRYLKKFDEQQAELEALKQQATARSKELSDRRPKTVPTTSALVQVFSLAEFKLRKAIRELPEKEGEIQDAFETLLHGADLQHSRERVHIPYSSKTYIPDFTFDDLDLVVELKLCNRESREKEIIAEINDDILAYKTKHGNLLFVVYDKGFIRDVDLFKSTFEGHPNVLVKVVKH